MRLRHHEQTPRPEHPFAQYIRALGKGKHGSRPLTQDEAYQAMRLIMQDQVMPVQLGAFLMLMRVKEETAEELAGFAQAVRERCALAEPRQADLDWSSYAGKRRHPPWFLLAALLLAGHGVRVFMHGAAGHTAGRLYTEQALLALGLEPATSVEQARRQLAATGFSYLPLRRFCPVLDEIIELRPLLGLRSPVHTLVRLLNPFNADHSFQGIFHPGYRPVHQQAAALLGQPHMAVLKGEGGEVERNPDLECLVQSVHDGQLVNEVWPPLFGRRHVKADSLDPGRLLALWRGELADEFAEASVVGTAAIALKLLGKADGQAEAHAVAQALWERRDRHQYPAG